MQTGETIKIFVYGTLRPPKPNTTQADTRFFAEIENGVTRHEPAQLPNALLYNIGTYPAIAPGENMVHGDLLWVTPEALARADQIEDHPRLYVRRQTNVQTADGEVEAWVYWANEALIAGKPRIETGDWFNRHKSASSAIDPALAEHVKRFAESDCSWLATVRPDGRAHCAPMWHAWYQGRIYLIAQPTSVKIKNIAHHPHVTITHPDPSNVIIIDGEAAEAPHMADAVRPLIQAKYDWDFVTDSAYQTVIEITPTKLMTWNNSPTQRWTREEILQVW